MALTTHRTLYGARYNPSRGKQFPPVTVAWDSKYRLLDAITGQAGTLTRATQATTKHGDNQVGLVGYNQPRWDEFGIRIEPQRTQLVEFSDPGGSETNFELLPCGITNQTAEKYVLVNAGDSLTYDLSSNWNRAAWAIQTWGKPPWASDDGEVHTLFEIRLDADNFVLASKIMDGTVELRTRAGGTEKATTLAPASPWAAGSERFFGHRFDGTDATLRYSQNADATLNTGTIAAVGTFAAGTYTLTVGARYDGSLPWDGGLNIAILCDGSSATPIIDRFNAGAGMPIEVWAAQFHDVSGVQYRESIVLHGPYSYDGTSVLRFCTDVPVDLRVGQSCALVGVCPLTLPAGMSELTDTHTEGDEFGNYLVDNSQSVMVWIPRFYYRITNVTAAPFYGTKTEISANPRSGFALHRAFIDGDKYHLGFFVDKYLWSNANADGTDNEDTTAGIAASIASRRPVSTHMDNNRISYLTGNSQTPTNTYGGCYAAAKSRGDDFAPFSIFVHSALAKLALAHAQAEPSTAIAAWMDVAPYAPKGCNNNVLGDAQDGAISYTTSGYSNQPLTGSGTPFAKTTHNGQACGVADLNGAMYELVAGLTNIGGPTASTYRILKETIALKDLIDATSGAYGAFGVTPYDLMDPLWWTDAAAWYYFGNATNQVLDGESSRSALAYHLDACGIMRDADGGAVGQVATNNFGGDGFYRKHTNLPAPLVGGYWGLSSSAGVWALYVTGNRTSSSGHVGSRSVLYV